MRAFSNQSESLEKAKPMEMHITFNAQLKTLKKDVHQSKLLPNRSPDMTIK